MFPTIDELLIVAVCFFTMSGFVLMLYFGGTLEAELIGWNTLNRLISVGVITVVVTIGAMMFFTAFHMVNYYDILDKAGQRSGRHEHPGRNFFQDKHYSRFHPEVGLGHETIGATGASEYIRDLFAGDDQQQEVQPEVKQQTMTVRREKPKEVNNVHTTER